MDAHQNWHDFDESICVDIFFPVTWTWLIPRLWQGGDRGVWARVLENKKRLKELRTFPQNTGAPKQIWTI